MVVSGSNGKERDYQKVLRGLAMLGSRSWESSWVDAYLSWPSNRWLGSGCSSLDCSALVQSMQLLGNCLRPHTSEKGM